MDFGIISFNMNNDPSSIKYEYYNFDKNERIIFNPGFL